MTLIVQRDSDTLLDMSDKKSEPTKKNLLMVEDEPELREVLAELLEPSNIVVIPASNGKEALEILVQRKDIDAILSDFKMPVMDGLTLLAEVRERGIETPFVLLTGFADKSNTITALRLRALDFLEKPFEPTELITRLGLATDLGHQNRLFQEKISEVSKSGVISFEIIDGLDRAMKATLPARKK